MILATIGSNYSLETNSLAVRRRKYLLKYLSGSGRAPASAGYSAGKRGMHSDRAAMCNASGIMALFLIRLLAIIL